jgi:hypothetical protein
VEKLTVELHNRQQAWGAIQAQVYPYLKAGLQNDRRLVLTVAPLTRSVEQNSRLWAMLSEVSAQVEWYGRKLTPEDWKHIFTASLRKLDVVPNLEGTGFVALGLHTSKMTVAEMTDLMQLMEAFGAERGVRFSAA